MKAKVLDELRGVFGRIETGMKTLVATSETHANQIAEMQRRLKIGQAMGDDYLNGVEDEVRADGSKGFQISRALYAGETGDWSKAGLEKEAIDQIKRDMELSDDTSIGFIVPPTVVAQIIPLLRSLMILDGLGVTMMGGLSGSKVDQPRETGDGSGYWIGENNSITQGADPTTDIMSLRPHTAAGLRKFSLKLLAAGGTGVEAFVRNGLAQRLARTIQSAFFEGLGAAGQPQGVFNHPNVNSITFSGAPTLLKLQQMEEELEVDNLNGNNFKWAMHPRAKHTTAQLTVNNVPILKRQDGSPGADGDAPTLLGYPVFTTTDITHASNNTDIALADWAMSVLADWGAMEIVSSGSAGDAFEKRMLWVRAVQDVDVGMMHEESLCLGDDVTA